MLNGYRDAVRELSVSGMLRTLVPCRHRDGQTVEVQGRRLINLSSNDYLGLAGDADLLARFYEPLISGGGVEHDRYGLGVASSRLLTGDVAVAHELERHLAALYRRKVLLFNSGYHANIGIMPALLTRRDLVLSDKLNHASMHDGLRIGRADCKRYNHCDYHHLRNLLETFREQYEQVLIISESVFSMDGDCADLAELVRLKNEFGCLLYLDEAHAVGLYGDRGLGIAEQSGLMDEVDLLVGTFGKACGSVGAFVVCDEAIYDYLVNHSRSLIFTTALPPVVLSWNLFVMQLIPGMTEKRERLARLSAQLRDALIKRGLRTGGSTNIVPVVIGPAELTVAGAANLRDAGFLVLPVRPPTVPEGTSRFRLSLTADLQWDTIADIPNRIESWLAENSPV